MQFMISFEYTEQRGENSLEFSPTTHIVFNVKTSNNKAAKLSYYLKKYHQIN